MKLHVHIGRLASSLGVTDAGERLIVLSHLSYWLFWMKYGLIGCRPLRLANIDFHSLFQLCALVRMCKCLPLNFFSLRLPHCPLVFSTLFLYSSLNLYRNCYQQMRQRRGGMSAQSMVTKGQTDWLRRSGGGQSMLQMDGVKDKEEVKERQRCGGRETDGVAEMKWRETEQETEAEREV